MSDAPLGVYVHWPYCERICPYCDFNVVRERGRTSEKARLIAAILDDLRLHARLTGPRRLVSIFLGGGTPSLLSPEDVGEIIALTRRLWRPDSELEVTLEANPTNAEAERFAAFAAAGVNRLSLGLQSLRDDSLARLARNHDAATGRRAAEQAGAVFPRVSLDLIYALPDQTPKNWAAELAEALALGPEHVSPYQLTIEAGTAFDRAVRRGTLRPPPEDRAADLYDTTQTVLGDAGYEAYEVSNHARGLHARSRHNLLYWRGEDYVGVGPGAHGRFTREGGRWASLAARSIGDYVLRVETGATLDGLERLSERDAALERLLMGLRTVEGVALADLAPLGVDSDRVADFPGLLTITGGRLSATPRGRSVLDRLTGDLAHGERSRP